MKPKVPKKLTDIVGLACFRKGVGSEDLKAIAALLTKISILG